MPAWKLSLHTSAAWHACMMIPFLNTTRALVLAVQHSFSWHDHYNIKGKAPGTMKQAIISKSLNLPFEIASAQVCDVQMISSHFITPCWLEVLRCLVFVFSVRTMTMSVILSTEHQNHMPWEERKVSQVFAAGSTAPVTTEPRQLKDVLSFILKQRSKSVKLLRRSGCLEY